MQKILIYDLDDTIFSTKSIPKHSVAHVLKVFEQASIPIYGTSTTEEIIHALWHRPFDVVSKTYHFNETIIAAFSKAIYQEPFQFDIQTFDDFRLYPSTINYLVTTGFMPLQTAKVKALNLEESFQEIYIDDILASNRIHKIGLFSRILSEQKYAPSSVYILGDNPDSELKAGHELGCQTIQMAKFGQAKSEHADFYIQTYHDLDAILGS